MSISQGSIFIVTLMIQLQLDQNMFCGDWFMLVASLLFFVGLVAIV